MTTLRILTRFHNSSFLIRNAQQTQQNLWQSTNLLRISTAHYCIDGINKRKTNQFDNYRAICSSLLLQNTRIQYLSTKKCPDHAGKTDSKSAAVTDIDLFGDSSKLGLFAKFKLMYKKYWYVLLPVHIVTSLGWLGGFYYLSKSGVDVPALLEYIHVSESIIEKVKHSEMGHIAIAYLCYKVATPLRYAVTLGGTTLSIKHLVTMGYIKPMPTKQELIQMYEDRKATRAAAAKAKEDAEAEAEAEARRQQKK